MRVNNLFSVLTFVAAPIAFCSLVSTGCTKKPEEVPLVQKISEDSVKLADEAVKNLKLQKIHEENFPDELSLMGRISVPEDRMTVVSARVGGRIDSVYVTSGEVVTPGQALASIFGPDFVIAKEEYLQSVKQAKDSPTDESTHILELSKRKLSTLGVSAGDVVRHGSDNSGRSDNLTVRATRGGAILDKKAMVGNFVNQGDTLFTIGDLSRVWFAGDIYPEDLSKVHKDQEISIETDMAPKTLLGTVSFISPVVDPTSRTVKIRALMENPNGQLRADMYVKGHIVLSQRRAVVAPKSALLRMGDTSYCFKRLPGNVFKKVIVTTSAESSTSVAIASGLVDGDEIVIEGELLLDAAVNGVEGS